MQELTKTNSQTDMLNNLPRCLRQEILTFDYQKGDETLNSDWKAKLEYPENTRRAALDALKAYPSYMGSADKKELAQWLSMLGILSAGKDSVQDSKAKTAAFAYMLCDYPSWVFSKQTLDECLRKNKFMTYSDICEVLDAKIKDRETIKNRLKIIAYSKPVEEVEQKKPTQEEKDQVSKLVQDYLDKSKNTSKRY